MHGNQIGLHVLILFIENKISIQGTGIAIFKKKPFFFSRERSFPHPLLPGKIAIFHDFPSRFLNGRSIQEIIGNLPFRLFSSVKAEIRLFILILHKQGMYIIFYVYFMIKIRFSCLYHVLRNLHVHTAFFSFNIAE